MRPAGTFEALGAWPWAQRAQREISATGERPQRRGITASGILTPQELQVCLVVARGQMNREVAAQLFLSLKTVESHLTSAYSKLGVRSRAELVRHFAMEPRGAALANALS